MKSLLVLLIDPEIGKPFPEDYKPQIGHTVNFWGDEKWVVVEKREKYYVLWNLKDEYAGYTYNGPLNSAHLYAGWSGVTKEMIEKCKVFRGPD